MTETIPNPLADKGVQADIEKKVSEIMAQPVRIGGLEIAVRIAVKKAAEWGMSEGFRMGWRVCEVTKGGKK